MYHLRFNGNHYDIGVKRGKIFKKCNIMFPLNLDDFQMEHGILSERILRKYFKEVVLSDDDYERVVEEILGW